MRAIVKIVILSLVALSNFGAAITCPPDEVEMAVQNLEGTFCADGAPLCGGDVFGDCPYPQAGLPFGSTCAVMKSGVFGCVQSSGARAGDDMVLNCRVKNMPKKKR